LFRELLDANLRLLQWHFDLPGDIDTDVQRDPDQKRPSLHGRLSFTFHAEGDREQHYCFRILGHANAIAFQARLKAAMTASGIDRALKFRHLFILRRDPPPGGAKTASLVKLFATLGGKFIAPSDEDLRRFIALQAVARRHPSGMESWLRTRKPLFETSFFKEAGLAPPAFLSAPPPGGQGGSGANATSKSMAAESVQTPRESQTRSDANDHGSAPTEAREAPAPRPTGTEADAPGSILLGRRFERGEFGDPVELSTDPLPRHVAILAGSGSGKTVLLRRIVEEAVLLGIPSIVLDINNDLSRLGEPWPTRPESFDADYVSKAVRYHERADVIIWTPGVSSGNPLFRQSNSVANASQDAPRPSAIPCRSLQSKYVPSPPCVN
jgi:Helicase HerA, central domain